MPTYDELAAALLNVQPWSTLAALTLIGVGIYLALAPIAECDKCAHCRYERMGKAGAFCAQHNMPAHECREQHRD